MGCNHRSVNDRRRVTLRDVARAASVSPSAAGAALRGEGRLHGETRARILAVAQELGYRRNALASSLRRSGNGVAATVLYNMPTADSSRRPTSFWEQAMFGYVQGLAGAGIGNVFVPAEEASTLLPDLPADVVVILNLPRDCDAPSIRIPAGVPTIRAVFTNVADSQDRHGPSGPPSSSIIWNYDAALDRVFSHLVDNGSQFPGLLLPPRPLSPAALVGAAQENWCQSHGLPVLRSESTDIEAGTKELLSLGCDGFLVHGDNSAGDVDVVLETIQGVGLRVPQDVLLVSISDGTKESRMNPPVTCLAYDGLPSGAHVADAVIDGVTTGEFRDAMIDWDLHVRESSSR